MDRHRIALMQLSLQNNKYRYNIVYRDVIINKNNKKPLFIYTLPSVCVRG